MICWNFVETLHYLRSNLVHNREWIPTCSITICFIATILAVIFSITLPWWGNTLITVSTLETCEINNHIHSIRKEFWETFDKIEIFKIITLIWSWIYQWRTLHGIVIWALWHLYWYGEWHIKYCKKTPDQFHHSFIVSGEFDPSIYLFIC